MQEAATESDLTLAVLSEAYLEAAYNQPEWAAAFAPDPIGKKRRFIPVRVAECTPTGLLSQVIHIDLVNLGEQDAERALLDGLKSSGQPTHPLPFPNKRAESSISTAPFPLDIAKPLGVPDLPPKYWNVPIRNRLFTGREDVLQTLHEELERDRRVALSGLGGIGKTQIAIEYAHRYRNDYNAVFFARTDTETALTAELVEIAGVLALPGRDARHQKDTVSAVKRWLREHDRWLLIADNADDLAVVKNVLSFDGPGRILLTTRAPCAGALAKAVKLNKMKSEEGACFLLRRAGLLGRDSGLESASSNQQADARKLSIELGGLALALDQAGAYIEETSCGLSGYLHLYRSHALELLRRRGKLTYDHPDPVATTWALSFENIEKANSAAAELLRFCAFLHPDAIPEELFSRGAPELGPLLGLAGSDALALNSAFEEILNYSLLRRDPSASTLEIHRLVQAVLKQAMDDATQRRWAERAVRAVNLAFPEVDFINWTACERLIPHVYACAALIKRLPFEFPKAGRLLDDAGFYLLERARYTEAESLLKRSLAINEKALGKEHADVAWSLNDLAGLYRIQARYAKAEPLYRRALEIREKALGPEHPDVARSLNGLGLLYAAQGQYAKAEPLYEQALAIREKALGLEHPDVAASLNNLARCYANQDQHAKAEPLYKRSLAIREKVLIQEHPDLAQSLNDLAKLYRIQRQYAMAEPLYKRALEIREKALGPEHPDVAWSLNDLAKLYRTQEQYAMAEPLYKRALAIRRKGLGREHIDLAWSLNGLAALYAAQHRYAKAERLYKRALAIREKALGPEHPDVARSLNGLARLYLTQGQYARAEPLYQRALAIGKKALRPGHPKLAHSLNNLAAVYHDEGQYAKAEPLYQRALVIREKALGPEHPDVATSLENYASFLRTVDRSQEAEPFESRARAIRAKRSPNCTCSDIDQSRWRPSSGAYS